MSYAIAAAGTGGHVYPALAVAEALVGLGVDRAAITFFGGTRFEVTAVPSAGYELVSLDLQGLKRSMSLDNLRLPFVVRGAARAVEQHIHRRGIGVLLATGGYVTVPAGWGARRAGIPYFVQEQNAEPGLANRIMSRWAQTAFTSFPNTRGLHRSEFIGNPVRQAIARVDRERLRADAMERYQLDHGVVTIGVVGGSLGAAALNRAVSDMVRGWRGPAIQIVHLAGEAHAGALADLAASSTGNPQGIKWQVVPFETDMEHFFAVVDLLIARAGGMVAEITATGTPALLVPGEFGSAGHQAASAHALTSAGAAVTVTEAKLGELSGLVTALVEDPKRRAAMKEASRSIGRPHAADEIASRLVEAHG